MKSSLATNSCYESERLVMPKHPYLSRSGPRGMWVYRRTVPARLRPILGKREILFAFGTEVLSDALPQYHHLAAEAEHSLSLAQSEWECREEDRLDEAEGVRNIINDLMPNLAGGPKPSCKQQCQQHNQQCLEAERRFRAETTRRVSNDPAAFWRGELLELPLSREAFYRLPAYASMRNSGEGFKFALAMAYRHRLQRRRGLLQAMLATQDFEAIARLKGCCGDCATGMGAALVRAELELIRALLADETALAAGGIDLDAAPTSSGGQRPGPGAAATGAPSLSHVVEEWINACGRGATSWSLERAALCRRVLQDFIATCGDRGIDAYGRRDGRTFLNLLRRLPANLEKIKGGLGIDRRNLEELARAAEARGLQPQDDATVNKKLGIVAQCFRWMATHYDECGRSPVEGMRVKVARGVRDQKDPFSVQQLNTMFRAPVYTGCLSELRWKEPGPNVLRNSAKFWVPLVGLYTGMRLNEICQLTRSHIRTQEGVHYFALTKDLRLKNEASIRSVPIHRDLVTCGLLAFVESCEDRLFPDLTQHRSGRLSDAFGKHFARFLKSLGIKLERLDFHSLRHNFIAAADASGLEFSARERLVGHVLQGQAGRYGKRYDQEVEDKQLLLRRNAELQKLEFPDLVLPGL